MPDLFSGFANALGDSAFVEFGDRAFVLLPVSRFPVRFDERYLRDRNCSTLEH
ncbi:MAG: hypothetical protein MUC48_00385 [Leptolyngbya sp. Prado105]|nr:hypothetical protein [Leptolyngbya sp. Prado105]